MSTSDDQTDGTGSDRSVPDPGTIRPGQMRVGDTERNSALHALGEHLSAGRITMDEYGDRSARVTVAKTGDELEALFDDLPAPHPVPPGAVAVTGRPAAVPPPGHGAVTGRPVAVPPPAGGDSRSTPQKLVAAAAAGSVFVALVLFFVTGWWYWFLLIPAISAIAGSIWGPDWKDPQGGGDDRRQLRDGRRLIRDDRDRFRRDRRQRRERGR